LHGKRQVAHRSESAVALGEAGDFNHGRGRCAVRQLLQA
jgi:hypothetical protein